MTLKKLLLLLGGVCLSSVSITAYSRLAIYSVTGNDLEAFLPVPRLMQGTTANVMRRECCVNATTAATTPLLRDHQTTVYSCVISGRPRGPSAIQPIHYGLDCLIMAV